MNKDRFLTQEINEYHEIEWEEEGFIEHVSKIILLNKILNSIHKIRSKDNFNMYLVPEDFYIRARRLLKASNNQEILATKI